MEVTTRDRSQRPVRESAARRREAAVTRRLELVAGAVAGLAGRLGVGGLATLADRHARPSRAGRSRRG